MSYKKDYEISRQVEIEFEQFIKEKYNLTTENSQEKGEFADWDISTTASTKNNNRVTTFEVKYNRNYTTGNAIIELHKGIVANGCISHTLPSGLSSTKADYYIFKFQNEEKYYLIQTEKLRALLTPNNPEITFIYDSNNYYIAIISKNILQENCKCVLVPNTPTPPITDPNQFNHYN